MLRFHLHLHNSNGLARDEEGEDFPDLASAERRAVEGIRSILSEEVIQGKIDLRGHVEIVNPAGDVLSTIRFSDVVVIHGDIP